MASQTKTTRTKLRSVALAAIGVGSLALLVSNVRVFLVLAGVAIATYTVGLFTSDIISSLSAASWADQAFSSSANLAIKWDDEVDGVITPDVRKAALVTKGRDGQTALRPSLAWRTLVRKSAAASRETAPQTGPQRAVAAAVVNSVNTPAPGPAATLPPASGSSEAAMGWDQIITDLRETFCSIRANMGMEMASA